VGLLAKFCVIRRTDWASAYQNASAAALIARFTSELEGFAGVVAFYWPDIDTAFGSRAGGDLRTEEKSILGAAFGLFDGTLLPNNGQWILICDANYMRWVDATSADWPAAISDGGPPRRSCYTVLVVKRLVESITPACGDLNEAVARIREKAAMVVFGRDCAHSRRRL
jgi:hypothetical protein